jgi:hypothetical protein
VTACACQADKSKTAGIKKFGRTSFGLVYASMNIPFFDKYRIAFNIVDSRYVKKNTINVLWGERRPSNRT